MDKSNKAGTQFEKSKIAKKLKMILQSTTFCTVCFDNDEELLHLDHSVAGEDLGGGTLTPREILEAIFGNTQSFLASVYICAPCKSSAYRSYNFIQKSKKTALLYTMYLDQLDRDMTNMSSSLTGNDCRAMIVLGNFYEKIEPFKELNETTDCYGCDTCGRSYTQKSLLIKHLIKHESSSNIKCPHCTSRPCIHEEYLESFQNQQKMKVKQKACTCGYEFGQTLECLIAHVNEEHLDKKINCECGETFFLDSHYKKHLVKHHPNRKVCKFCFRKFRTVKNFEKHIETCVNSEKPFKCSHCPVISETKRINELHMATHASSNSTKQRKYICQICNRVLKTKLKLRSHILKHEKKPNLCLYCNKQFNSRKEYLTHIQSEEHRKAAPFGFNHHCQHCSYSTNSDDMLKTHMNRVHLNIRPFECDYCPKRYFNSTQLKNHVKSHTGQKTKVCDICDARLAGPTALKKHRRLHTGENPYSCPHCDVKTICGSSLKTHIMSKHMEPTISCPLCGLKFHTMNNARGHVRKTHWKSKEKFDYTKLKGLSPKDYDFFRDRRKAVL